MTWIFLIALASAFVWAISLYWGGKPWHTFRLVVPPVVGLLFLVNAVLYPEQRYVSLFIAIVAAGGVLRAYQTRKTLA